MGGGGLLLSGVQWYIGQPGDTSNPITGDWSLTPPAPSSTTTYWARVTSAYGTVDSQGATITVAYTSQNPIILTQPLAINGGYAENYYQLSVAAYGPGPLTYQWYNGSEPVVGANSNTLAFQPATLADNGTYTVTVSNANGSVTSDPVVAQFIGQPVITSQPVSQSVGVGGTVTFSVGATGGALQYEWTDLGNQQYNYATSVSTLTLSNITANQAGSYVVRVSNSIGGVNSTPFNLTVTGTSAPTITTQPQSLGVVAGASATFSVVASAPSALSYQWSLNGASLTDGSGISGSTTASLSISQTSALNVGTYTVTVSDSAGSITSAPATLAVGTLPSFALQPVATTAPVGGTASFTTIVGGTPAPTYQWYYNGTALADGNGISGSATGQLTLANVQVGNVGSYTLVATNAIGSVTSMPATLATGVSAAAPVIATQPASQLLFTGSTVVFSVNRSGLVQSSVVGTPRPGRTNALAGVSAEDTGTSYQWFFNGTPIAGATNSSVIVTATGATAGTYNCVVANAYGDVLSNAAVLSVSDTASPGRLGNLSVNSVANSGSQLLTVGFVSGGAGTSGSEPVLVRATGPALAAYGVTGFLPDPQLTLFNSVPSVVTSDAGWGSTPANAAAVMAADSATFAFALSDNTSKDSATVATLAGGQGYTVQVSSVSGATGRALAEIFDDTAAGSYTATSPRLVNLSCRILVSAGGNLTEGFTIGGATAKTVLIRASGPALAAFGVNNFMPDPQVSVFAAGSLPTQIAYNAGWGGDPTIVAATNAVYAFSLGSTSSHDCAVVMTLPPGGYTAQVSSVSGVAGVTLIEVYEVP